MNRSFVASSVISTFLLLACGDSSSAGGGGSAGSATDGGGGSTTDGGGGSTTDGGGGSTVDCEPPPATPGAVNEVPLTSVAATAQDETGDPVAMVPMQLCGADNCLFATTNAIGMATFTGSDSLDRPVFKPGDSLTYAKIGYPYTGGPTMSGVFPLIVDSGSQFAAGATVTADDVSLTVPSGGAVVVNELIYDEPAKQTFRAVTVSDAAQVAQITGEAGFAMVVGLGPVDTLFCPGVAVSIPNTAKLGANTAVEVLGQELDIGEHFGGYSEWAVVAEGAVSADGSTIEISDLPVLLTIAIRIK
jgi:hypothetical protein